MTLQRTDILLGCIYESALLPEGFHSLIAAFVDLFRLEAAALLTTDLDTLEISSLWVQGLQPEWISHYVREHVAREALVCHAQASLITVFPAPGGEGIPGRSASKDARSPVKAIILRDGPWLTGVILQRSSSQIPFCPNELELFHVLMPHVHRAIRMRNRLEDSRRDSQFLARCLDMIPMPAALVSQCGTVMHGNRSAADLLQGRHDLWMEDGRLHGRASVMQQLNREIAGVVDAARRAEAATPGLVSVPRAGRRDLTVLVSPMRAAGQAPASDAALLLVFDPDAVPHVAATLLQRLFCLSEAEAQLAAALCSGRSLEEVSAERGTSMNTVRSQVKSIFGKTGTNRQADLVSLLMASPAYLISRN